MENKIYQVFISSTYTDLQDERRAVAEAISKSGQIPAGMEYFPASSQEQFEYIKKIIDRCDYYVLIIAGKYGSISETGISFTEEEYKYAVSKGIPVLAFLYRNTDKLTLEKLEKEPNKIEMLEKFRNEVKNKRLVEFWDDSKELPTKVTIALIHEMNLNPGIGWVRADRAMDPKIYEENERLRQRISQLESEERPIEFKFPSNLNPIDSKLEMSLHVAEMQRTGPNGRDEIKSVKEINFETTWRELFQILSQKLLMPKTRQNLTEDIKSHILEENSMISGNGIYYDSEIKDEYIDRIIDNYILYGLINSIESKHSYSGSSLIVESVYYVTHYILTDFGKKFRAFLSVKQNT